MQSESTRSQVTVIITPHSETRKRSTSAWKTRCPVAIWFLSGGAFCAARGQAVRGQDNVRHVANLAFATRH